MQLLGDTSQHKALKPSANTQNEMYQPPCLSLHYQQSRPCSVCLASPLDILATFSETHELQCTQCCWPCLDHISLSAWKAPVTPWIGAGDWAPRLWSWHAYPAGRSLLVYTFHVFGTYFMCAKLVRPTQPQKVSPLHREVDTGEPTWQQKWSQYHWSLLAEMVTASAATLTDEVLSTLTSTLSGSELPPLTGPSLVYCWGPVTVLGNLDEGGSGEVMSSS